MSAVTRCPIPYDSPATYQICAQGRISPTWSDHIEGMTISLDSGEDSAAIATLFGELPDQAALIGVLTTLYEWHLTLLSVTRINKEGEN